MQASNRFLNEGWTQEVPSGTINGSNKAFTLTYTPDEAASVVVFLDGIVQRLTTDYTFSGTTITFVSAPAVGQDLYCVYQKRT